MKLTSIEIIPYSFPFSAPCIISRKTYSGRTGLFVEIRSDGISALGEISPLEEFGSEDLVVATTHSGLIRDELLRVGCINTLDEIHEILGRFSLSPATVSGFEQALLSLLCKCSGTSIHELFGVKKKNTLQVNGVIGLLPQKEIETQIESLIYRGYSTVKLKIGREQIDEDIHHVKDFLGKYGDKIIFRLDANGFYSVKSAQYLLKALAGLQIEYIEQPVQNLADFIELREISDIPIAVDESLRNHSDAEYIIKHNLAQVFIIKPGIAGSLFEVIELIRLAEYNDIKGVITTSLDTGIGKRKAVFAASLLHDDIACGLTIPDGMQKGFYMDHYPVQNGVIHINEFSI